MQSAQRILLGLLAYEASAANRMLRAAGVTIDAARDMISVFYDSVAVPVTAQNIRFIATSKWGVRM